jgi:hypothetical protein
MASSAVVNAGQSVTVTGTGFTPGGDVVLSVGDAADLLSLSRADGSGRIQVQAAIPAELPFGRQVLQAADAAGRLATVSLLVANGGWPPAVVRLSGEAQLDQIDYVLRVENRSEWALRNVVVRVALPPGARVLADGLGQPESAEAAAIEDGQIVWRLASLPSHSIQGPFEFSVLTTGLSWGAEVAATATVQFAHTWPPLFRGSAQSEELRVQVIVR